MAQEWKSSTNRPCSFSALLLGTLLFTLQNCLICTVCWSVKSWPTPFHVQTQKSNFSHTWAFPTRRRNNRMDVTIPHHSYPISHSSVSSQPSIRESWLPSSAWWGQAFIRYIKASNYKAKPTATITVITILLLWIVVYPLLWFSFVSSVLYAFRAFAGRYSSGLPSTFIEFWLGCTQERSWASIDSRCLLVLLING